MTGNRKPFGLAQCLFLRGHVLMTAPVPPFRAASHAEGDPRALVAVASGAEAMGAALAQVLCAGLAGWAAPLLAHDSAAAVSAAQAAQAAQADLVKAANAGKAQARAETGMVWATTRGDGRVLLAPSKQARGTLAFDGLPFSLEAPLDNANATGQALLTAIALCRGTAAFEGTLPLLGVADLAQIGESVLVAPRHPARSEQSFPHLPAGEVLDLATAGPQALDAALVRAIAASRSVAIAAPPAERPAPKAAGASLQVWTVAEVPGSGIWHGPATRSPRRASDPLPIWRALPDVPDGARVEVLLDAISATQGNA